MTLINRIAEFHVFSMRAKTRTTRLRTVAKSATVCHDRFLWHTPTTTHSSSIPSAPYLFEYMCSRVCMAESFWGLRLKSGVLVALVAKAVTIPFSFLGICVFIEEKAPLIAHSGSDEEEEGRRKKNDTNHVRTLHPHKYQKTPERTSARKPKAANLCGPLSCIMFGCDRTFETLQLLLLFPFSKFKPRERERECAGTPYRV